VQNTNGKRPIQSVCCGKGNGILKVGTKIFPANMVTAIAMHLSTYIVQICTAKIPKLVPKTHTCRQSFLTLSVTANDS
jgi:hypothetical protein